MHTWQAPPPFGSVQFSGAQLISAAIVQDKQMALQTFSHVARPAVAPLISPLGCLLWPSYILVLLTMVTD